MLKLGRAQGVSIAAALNSKIPITEYSPKKIKMAITGNGNSSKEQVAKMLKSMLKIKELPKDTEIYCGHEYTLQNSIFCLKNDSENTKLKEKIVQVKDKINNNLPTLPTTLADELECNIFLKAKDLKTFSKLRDLKDNF